MHTKNSFDGDVGTCDVSKLDVAIFDALCSLGRKRVEKPWARQIVKGPLYESNYQQARSVCDRI